MCGSGPYERDENGKTQDSRTRTVEVLDLLDPNFKKVIHTNFPLRDHCFGGILNNTPFFGGGFAQHSDQKDNDVFVLDKFKTKMKMKDGRSGAACAKMKGNVYWIFGGWYLKKIYLTHFIRCRFLHISKIKFVNLLQDRRNIPHSTPQKLLYMIPLTILGVSTNLRLWTGTPITVIWTFKFMAIVWLILMTNICF